MVKTWTFWIGFSLILIGLVLFLVSSIPVTRVVEVINTSFTISPGNKYGPYDNGTYYHTMIFVKSVLKGEVVVEGEGIYLTARGYNVQDLKDTYVKEKCSFTVDPADDQYTFTFDNTKGEAESMVRFRLTEVWTASFSPPIWIMGFIGLFLLLPIGLVVLTYSYFRSKREGLV